MDVGVEDDEASATTEHRWLCGGFGLIREEGRGRVGKEGLSIFIFTLISIQPILIIQLKNIHRF